MLQFGLFMLLGVNWNPDLAALISACRDAGGRVLPVSENLLSRISRKDNAQMVIGAYAQSWTNFDEMDTISSPLVAGWP